MGGGVLIVTNNSRDSFFTKKIALLNVVITKKSNSCQNTVYYTGQKFTKKQILWGGGAGQISTEPKSNVYVKYTFGTHV